jgi:hypothetical protein
VLCDIVMCITYFYINSHNIKYATKYRFYAIPIILIVE